MIIRYLHYVERATRKVVSDSLMGAEEACKVLHVPPGAPLDEVKRRFEQTFRANETGSGGTLYLQSKILRAYESILASRNKPDSPV